VTLAEATPKGILKLMNSDGLTIYHIKSHLQVHSFFFLQIKKATFLNSSAVKKFQI